MKKRLLLIGGGGHCKSVIDSVIASESFDDIGIVDNATVRPYNGVGVVGDDNNLSELFHQGWSDAFITVGSVGVNESRQRLYALIKTLGFNVPIIADPTAAIASDALFAEGTFIGKNAVVNACVQTGICSIINSSAIIEHDCRVGDFAHISPGAILCGQVNIGNNSHVGAGAVVRQLINIGNNVLVGAGSVVVKDIKDGVTAYGNPCKVVDR